MVDVQVCVRGGSPQNFHLQGDKDAKEIHVPIRITTGDIAPNELSEKQTPEKTKVSLTIRPMHSVSCEAVNVSADDGDIVNGTYTATYMENKATDTDYPPVGGARCRTPQRNSSTNTESAIPHHEFSSRSLPRQRAKPFHTSEYRPDVEITIPHPDFSSKSLPRQRPMPFHTNRHKSEAENTMRTPHPEYSSKSLPRQRPKPFHTNGHRTETDTTTPHPEYSSKSLPRQRGRPFHTNEYIYSEYRTNSLPRSKSTTSIPRSKSTSDVPSKSNKAPSWYRHMCNEMQSSMEKDSNLSRLLQADAKEGVFREYDGVTKYNAATYEDAPRRLRDGRNRPHRKSLPNIHAANFNFMGDYSQRNIDTRSTPTTPESQSTLSHDWYKQGGEITGAGFSSAPGTPPHSLPSPQLKTITVKYNNPPDFLELRKQEIRNREIEKECEELRGKREKERLAEEHKLLEKKTHDFFRLEEEKRRLELKDQELRLRERILSQQEEEQRHRRTLKKENVLNKEDDDKFKLIEEEIQRKEREELRLLQLKEEKLKRKEERLLKQEKELEALRLSKVKQEEHLRKLRKQEEVKRQEVEAEEKRKLEARDERLLRLKEEEERKEAERQRILKVKQEEREREEQEDLRILKHKDEELKRKQNVLKIEVEQAMYISKKLEDSLKPKLSPFGKAKYSFHPQSPGELEFKKGEIITILESIDENWIEGELKGKVGIFPISYVDLLDNLPGENIPDAKSELTTDSPSGTLISAEKLKTINKVPGNDMESSEEVIVKTELNVESTPSDLFNDTDVVDKTPSSHEEPGIARALYTFKAESETELSFKKGDWIVLIKRIDDNWYAGELDGHIGIFPTNYVKVTKEPTIVVVPATEPEPLPEPVVLSGKNGIIPDEKEKNIKEDTLMVNGPAIDGLVGQGTPYKAIYKYTATNEDEIELYKGDVVRVLEKCDDNWYIGTSERTKAFGIFPGNYVLPL